MKTMIVYSGKNILQSNTEALQPVDIQGIFHRIKSDAGLSEEIARIRKVAAIDVQAYQKVKTRLPFFCCADCKGGIRRGENFLKADSFVIDIDAIKDKEVLCSVRENLLRDPRIKLLFVSPSGKGLKVVMELCKPMTSVKQFSNFYKIFVHRFAAFYHLEENVDFATSDVTRVTFLSYDEEAFFNPMNEQVDSTSYLPLENRVTWTESDVVKVATDVQKLSTDPDEQICCEIRDRLNPKGHPVSKPREIFVPEILNQLEGPLRAASLQVGLEVKEIRNIQYGKKIILGKGLRIGEVNLFFGKKGFSVVKSTKTGTDEKMAELAEMLVWNVLAEFKGSTQNASNSIPFLTIN